ncbi:filamentous hemagglutinin N-terminal domain-containing protein [Salmonella enterica]|nr:filamentous hemagglutinin N-terminal domain-containing protein [Salmonella enterica]
MNKIYKLKYDRRRNQVVAVSELTAGAGKESTGQVAALAGLTDMCSFRKLLGTLTPLAFLTGLVMSLLPGIALANPDLPTGGQIVAGQGSISTNGNQMTISQNTHGLVTNWSTFDVGQNHTVQFVQPDSSAVALNRVTGGHESQILGTLTANGQVMLVNPAGVMFGKGATVNTAGLVASTKNISNADFMAGHYTFTGGSDAGAEVVNQGNLTTTKGGFIVLAADRVKNSGNIRTPGGKTVLAAGDKVTLQLDNTGLASVSVSGSVVNALVENSGLLSATDGRVYLTARGKDMLLNTVVNNTGTVEASGLSGHGGEIVLNGGDSGVVSQSGTLLAGSKTGRGGKITVEGQNIHLAANSRTSATGKTGGGEVYVGGGWQGKDSHIRNASKVVMDKSATIDVSATESGNGGTAVLWSDDYTNFRGTILAKGGTQSGNGGRVETSSHRNLQAFGDVDTSAVAGQGGNWLLDPLDVTIVGGNADSGITESGKGTKATLDTDTDHIFSPSATGAQVSAQKIAGQLNNGTSVTVDTHGDGSQEGNITVNADILKTAGADATLTLKADNQISTKEKTKIGSSSGKLNLNLLAGNITNNASIELGKFINISLKGGDFNAGPANKNNNVSLNFTNNGKITAGNITMDVARGLRGYAFSLFSDNNLTINGSVDSSTGWGVTTNFSAGGLLTLNAAQGNISFSANDTTNGGGHVALSGGGSVKIETHNGTISFISSGGKLTSAKIKSNNGDILLKAHNPSTGKVSGVVLSNADISASNGSVMINGTTPGHYSGVRLNNVNVTANASTGTVDIYGESRGENNFGTEKGSVALSGISSFTADKIILTGNNTRSSYIGTGINFEDNSNTSFNGNATIVGYGDGNAITYWGCATLSFYGVIASISGYSTGPGGGGAYYGNGVFQSKLVSWENRKVKLLVNLNNTKLDMMFDASSTTQGKVPAFGANNIGNGNYTDGVVFNGVGDVSITGIANDGNGVDSRLFNNTELTGSLGIVGISKEGVGVVYDGSLNISLKNATINGSSQRGVGVSINASSGVTDLNNNNITGISNNSAGTAVKGNNVTITNGSLNGTSVGGAGVILTGGADYTLSGANVSGQSANGPGIAVSGNLTVNNNVTLSGSASGTGNGVYVTGNLQSTGGVTINGTSADGNGVAVSGNTSLTNATVSGNSTSGSGVNIAGQLTADGHTALNGTSVSGSGLMLSDASVTNASLSGNSTSGSGVIVSGSVSLDEHSAQNLNATSVSGSGLALSDTNITVVDDNGVAVTSPVELTGQSSTGSGITTSGNTTLNTVILNGTTSSDEGAGLTVSGNLTIGDTLSGLTGSTSGNGSGVVIDNATINTDSYTQAGKDFTINGSSTGNGTAIKAQGDNQLTNVTLNGSASGNGSAIEVSGNVTGGVIKGESSTVNGTAVDIVGNAALSGTNVSGNASAGTGVSISGDASLNNATLDGQTQTGKGVDVSGSLTGSGSTTVAGQANGSGTGTSLSGVLNGGHLSGTSTEGTGAVVSNSSSVNNASVNGSSNMGTGIQWGSNVTHNNVSITGNSTAGSGVYLEDNTTLTNSTVSGSTESGKGVDITGNLTNTGNSTVVGNASGDGTGVDLGGNVTGGSISGGSVNGSGVTVSGNSTATNTAVSGNTTNGKGVDITGNLTNTGNSMVVGNASGNGTGTNISGTLNGAVTGSSETGTGVHVNDGAHISAGSNVTGSSDTGSGTVVAGNINNLGQISGTSNKGDGLNLNATVSGGGKLVGNSVDGTGVHVSGNSAMNGGSLSGSTTNGSGLHLEGNLQHTPDSTINSSVAIGGHGQESTGQGGIVEVKPPVDPGKPESPVDKQVEKTMSVISRQQVITGQTWHRGTALQTSGYRSSEEPVEIEICVDGTCQSANVHRQLSSASEGK